MTKSFNSTLERDGEEIEILVTYTANSDELFMESVEVKGTTGDILITKEEGLTLEAEMESDFDHYKIHNL